MTEVLEQKSTAPASAIKVDITKSPITFDNIHVNDYQKPGTKTVQIRQVVKTISHYPSQRVGSDLQDNLFEQEEFNFEGKSYENIEQRVAWLLIPENMTEETAKARIEAANAAGATIYRVLSNEPVLDENQLSAIERGLRTRDDFANRQVVRYGKESEHAGKITLDNNGLVQYRRTFFRKTSQADVDNRGLDKPQYVSPEIKAELEGASVMQGQTL